LYTDLNLASRPFSNRALPWIVSGSVILVSLVALVLIVRATSQANAAAAAVRNDINTLSQQEAALRKQAEDVKNSLSPEQIQSVRAAHELVDRKQFSWSRLLADLESSLPGNVKVTRISIKDVATRGSQTVAELELSVISKTPETVTQMISDMERSGVFQAELRAQNLQKGRGESGTEYDLYVVYRPRGVALSSESQTSNLAAAENANGQLR
jgi:Tfp pilus assembly protein PilN